MTASRSSSLLYAHGQQHLFSVRTTVYRASEVHVQWQLLHSRFGPGQALAASFTRSQLRRNASSSSGSQDGIPKRQPRPPTPPPPSVGQILLRAVDFRNLARLFRGQSWRTIYRQNPLELILAVAALVACAGVVVFVVVSYYTYFYGPQFTRYPAPIAKSLRRALYYSNYKLDSKLALKYYKLALQQCDEFGLDRFSDEVMGIKIELAGWLEKIGSYDNSAKVLEALLADCKRWVEAMEQSVKTGSPLDKLAPVPAKDQEDGDGRAGTSAPDAELETIYRKRTRILAKAVAISIKLGDLYSDDHVLEQDLAHERLTWGVETALREARRRQVEGLKLGEGDWMGPEAIGAALESLGQSYVAKSQFHLALPLFFQALRLCNDPCHAAVLMNNLAISFAQHPVQAPFDILLPLEEGREHLASASSAPAEIQTRSNLLDSARRWATNALQHATDTAGERRTSECDEACAVSLCNLGDIASLSGNVAEARKRFEEAVATSKKIGFAAGIQQAEDGIRRLSELPSRG